MRLTPFVTFVLCGAAVVSLGADDAAPEGLVVEVELATKGPVQPGDPIEAKIKLVNRSKTTTHRVVQARDGSECGWREPHVFWTATLVSADGVEHPLAPSPAATPGLFAAEWWKDVTSLAPARWLAIDAITPAQNAFDVQADGKLRLVAHYAWTGGAGSHADPMSGGGGAPADLGGMKGVAPYDLASAPVVVEIRRAFEVVFVAKGAFKVGISRRLSEIVAASVHSRSTSALTFDPAEWRATLMNDEEKGVATPDQDPVVPKTWGAAFQLAPDATTPLLHDGPLGAGRDVTLRFDEPGKARIAVTLQRVAGGTTRIRSEWIEVPVEK
jgi:hypothetical protein